MLENVKWISMISISCTAISAVLGIIVYIRQQKVNRIQNLIAVFQRFSNNDDFINIFSKCDASYVLSADNGKSNDLLTVINELKIISAEKKYKYLALLEEIAILAKNSAVINKNALHLFKFHFYYVYSAPEISAAFWNNVGSGPNEKNKEGWSYQRLFAKKCDAKIKHD